MYVCVVELQVYTGALAVLGDDDVVEWWTAKVCGISNGLQ